MKKIIYLDVGTHLGQEFLSLWGKDIDFYIFALRRLVGFYLFRRGDKFTINELLSIYNQRKLAKKNKKKFIFYFIEANSKIISHADVYNQADGVFNCAIKDDNEVDIIKLFIANNNNLSQGNSIYKTKPNIEENDFLPTLGISSDHFFRIFKKNCDEVAKEYELILRVNCEGVEDSVIYSAHANFKEKLVLILGSIKDVKYCKSPKAHDDLIAYIDKHRLSFVFFSPSPKSWLKAHKAITDRLI